MHRVLIAGGSSYFHKAMIESLEEKFEVLAVADGMDVLGAIDKFDPHILCIDMHMQESDSLAVIRTIRTSGKNICIIAMVDSAYCDAFTAAYKLVVDHILIRPFLYSYVSQMVRNCSDQLKNGVKTQMYLENELDQILADLGFRMGTERYRMLRYVILLRCSITEDILLKELYLDAAKELKSCYSRIEKAIREGIKSTWRTCNNSCWRAYFSADAEAMHCPTSDEFITVIAHCLVRKGRLHKEYLL